MSNLHNHEPEQLSNVFFTHENFQQAILDSLLAHIAVIDSKGVIVAVNAAWDSYQNEQGGDSKSSLGLNYLTVCDNAHGPYEPTAKAAASGIRAVLAGTQSQFTLEYPCHTLTDQSWYLMHVTPLPYKSGAVIAHTDITERKLAEDALRSLEQRESAFIDIANHELKTPIAALKSLIQYSERLLKKHDTRPQLPYLVKMEEQVNNLTSIVDALLNMTRIESNQLDYIDEPFYPDTLLREIVETLQHLHPEFLLLIHGRLDRPINADRDKMRSVFLNLLNNAIKYSPHSRQVDIFLHTSSDSFTVTIQDYGIGIAKEQQKAIFERFFRASLAQKKAIPGLGLGLYITHAIVTHYGGELNVESEEGKGSRFSITLPLSPEHRQHVRHMLH